MFGGPPSNLNSANTLGFEDILKMPIFPAIRYLIYNHIMMISLCVFAVTPRGAKDAILERNEEAFIAEVRDAVVNELEVAKQRANAYAIWKEQERPPNAFKRGLNSIRYYLCTCEGSCSGGSV